MLYLFILSLSGIFAMETLDVNGSHEKESVFWSLTQDQSTTDVFQKLPNVTYTSGANRPRFFQIRGVGERSQFDTLNQSPVGFFYEEIDLSEESHAVVSKNKTFVVHKESRSVQYGSKAMGGMIRASSCLNNDCQKDEVEFGVESFETTYGTFVMSHNWSEDFTTSISFHERASQGYQENHFLNRRTGDQRESYIELHNTYSGNIAFETHHIFSRQRSGYDYFNVNNDYISDSDRPGRENSDIQGHSMILEVPLNELALKSISSYTQSKLDQSYDEDWGNDPFWNTVVGWSQDYDYFSQNRFKKTKLHQKFIIESDSSQWGLHYYSMDDAVDNTGYKNGAIRSELDRGSLTQSFATFSNHVHKWGKWSLRDSLRIEYQGRELEGGSIDERDQEWLWALELEGKYLLSKNKSLSSRLSKAFRGGGYNLDTSLDSSRRSYKSEDLYLAEIGLNHVGVGSSYGAKLFYIFRNDMQLRTSFQDDPMDPSSFSFYTDNASQAQTYGGEIDGRWVNNSWSFHVSLAALISRFDDYRYEGVDLTQRELPYTPTYSFLGEVSYEWVESLKTSLSFYGQEAFYFSNSHSKRSEPYQLLDFNLNYEVSSWNFLFWVKNIFDNHYSLRGFYFANEPPAWMSKLYTQPAPPRSLGVQVSYRF